ncbi:hypothetical protein AWU68_2149 [Corynebacterium simulans]|nr:hypothetical protein AWU68_2149 [Corynebacterium simulans]
MNLDKQVQLAVHDGATICTGSELHGTANYNTLIVLTDARRLRLLP